jgi:carbonic anhydrase/acetyltransferase-like protein (isoleucine patch superfamily)
MPHLVMIYTFEQRSAAVGESCFVADTAVLIGSVILHDNVSVWFNAVLRGDSDVIEVGAGSNIQDGAVLHTDAGMRLTLGPGVTVGHKAMLHGCEVGAHSLIGIGSIILNRARIGQECIIGANALVAEGKDIPDRSLVLGTPGRVVRSLTDAEVQALRESALGYVRKSRRYLRELRPDERFRPPEE